MKIKSESPWCIENLEELLFYCCPECDEKNANREQFLEHALIAHPQSQEYLQNFHLKEEPIDELGKDDGIGDLAEFYEADVSINEHDNLELGELEEEYFQSDDINDNIKEDPDEDFSVKKVKKLKSKSHGSTSNKVKSFQCVPCNQTFSKWVDLKNHNKEVHIQVDPDGQEKYHCTSCQLSFDTKPKFEYHVKNMHTKEKEHKCSYCEKSFGRPLHLKKHIKSDHFDKYLKCDYCGKSCNSETSLQYHIKVNHEGGSKDHQCDQCGTAFSSKMAVEKHIKVIHQGIKNEKTEKCHLCEKKYAAKADLRIHIKLFHEGIKEYSCEFCGKNFGRPEHIRKHIRKIHEGQRNYKCNMCEKAFFDKCRLKKHIDGVHLKVKNNKCHLCNSAFTRVHHLQTHLKLVHKEILSYKDVRAMSLEENKHNNAETRTDEFVL